MAINRTTPNIKPGIKPNIQLNIDEVAIKNNEHLSEPQVRRAVEQELQRYFGERTAAGNPADGHAGGASTVNIHDLHLKVAPGTGAGDIGRQVAHRVHAGLEGGHKQ